MTSDAQHPLHRRRRHQRRRNLLAIADTSTTPATSNNSPHEPTITPYTINQSICPSTHATILEPLVTKHIHALPQYWKNKPTAIHNEEAFEYALEFVIRFGQQLPKESSLHSSSMRGRTKVILDSGCGTGKSSHILGERYPDCVVVGIDQSLARLNRNNAYRYETNGKNSNVLLLRADVTDFWKLCLASTQWHHHAVIVQHYLLYPNPYPKKSRLMNRFYAHPAFPLMMLTLTMDSNDDSGGGGGIGYGDVVSNNKLDIGNEKLVVRSNWKGYLDEFRVASDVWLQSGGNFHDWQAFISNNKDGSESYCWDNEWYPNSKPSPWEIVGPNQLDGDIISPMTNFESKFLQVGEAVYELSIVKRS
ncbi:hypothetical protein ACHAWU_001687 [Discostella pseudostelligera]|uniref:tRNA (guanine(46)-N(7))-methyltransferase n=1 Tax=Discostella pseudostelligera TaxID=259834 RepID=A0ABD3MDC3_9STRA